MRRVLLILLLCLAACPDDRDPCEGVTCPRDRICIVLDSGATCVCADPAVELDGECVDEGEGEWLAARLGRCAHSSKLRNIHAVFSWTCMRCVSRSQVG